MKFVLQSTTVSYHSVPYNWPKPSIWHHFLFSLTITNAVIISKVFVAHSEEKQVVQLANKARLWSHMQSASLVSALHSNSICYMVVMHYHYYWLTHILTAHSRVFTFMLWWCRCVPYVKLCFGHLCVFLNAETSHLGEKNIKYTICWFISQVSTYLWCESRIRHRLKINQNIIKCIKMSNIKFQRWFQVKWFVCLGVMTQMKNGWTTRCLLLMLWREKMFKSIMCFLIFHHV